MKDVIPSQTGLETGINDKLNIVDGNYFIKQPWSLAHGRSLDLGEKSKIMGVLNTTPDSFSDGGDFLDTSTALGRAREMAAEGAHIIDIGGESTRPGAERISIDVELQRIIPVISRCSTQSETIVSVDTYRAKTAEKAVESGAHIVNDVWGCQREPDIARVAADTGAGLVIMNTRRDRTVLPDLLQDAVEFLSVSLEIADKAGVDRRQIVLDPGFGFADTIDHDIPILDRLEILHTFELPILVGTSRKRFLGAITGREAADRGAATAATSVIARMKGAAIARVHDITMNKDALAVADALIEARLDNGH